MEEWEPDPDNWASGTVDLDRIDPPGSLGLKNRVPLDKSINPALSEPSFGGSLGLADPVTEQSDLAMVWRGPECSLGQDTLGETIFLYSTEGLLSFGSLSTGLGTREAAVDGKL